MRFNRYLTEDGIGISLLILLVVYPAGEYVVSRFRNFDDQRRGEVAAISRALEAYAKTHGGKYRVNGGTNGVGWVNLPSEGRSSIVSVLHANGFLQKSDLDDPETRPGYMLYLCDDDRRYSISATLKYPKESDLVQAKGGCNALGLNGTVEAYKKNYSVGN